MNNNVFRVKVSKKAVYIILKTNAPLAAAGRWASVAKGPDPGGRHGRMAQSVIIDNDSGADDSSPESPGSRAAAQFQSARVMLQNEQSRKRKLGGGGGGVGGGGAAGGRVGGASHSYEQPPPGQNMFDSRSVCFILQCLFAYRTAPTYFTKTADIWPVEINSHLSSLTFRRVRMALFMMRLYGCVHDAFVSLCSCLVRIALVSHSSSFTF